MSPLRHPGHEWHATPLLFDICWSCDGDPLGKLTVRPLRWLSALVTLLPHPCAARWTRWRGTAVLASSSMLMCPFCKMSIQLWFPTYSWYTTNKEDLRSAERFSPLDHSSTPSQPPYFLEQLVWLLLKFISQLVFTVCLCFRVWRSAIPASPPLLTSSRQIPTSWSSCQTLPFVSSRVLVDINLCYNPEKCFKADLVSVYSSKHWFCAIVWLVSFAWVPQVGFKLLSVAVGTVWIRAWRHQAVWLSASRGLKIKWYRLI